MAGQLGVSFGPQTSIDAVTSTGGGTWIKPRGPLSKWAYTITTAGSTSTVTVKHKLDGTLSESTAPVAADIFSVSTGSGVGTVQAISKIARQVRVNITAAITSTSSTAVTATGVVAGVL